MFLAMAGAMSTAELGISLAEMIREGKVHAVSCTGANLEEDVFNLVAHSHYERLPNYRDLTPRDEQALLDSASQSRHRYLHPRRGGDAADRAAGHAGMAGVGSKRGAAIPAPVPVPALLSGTLQPLYEIDEKDSWLLAAAKADLPMFVPGWEDSTLGNCTRRRPCPAPCIAFTR